MMRFCSSSIS